MDHHTGFDLAGKENTFLARHVHDEKPAQGTLRQLPIE